MNYGSKVLIVLNDGTDEVFNIHSYDVHCRDQVMLEIAETFVSSGMIIDVYQDGLLRNDLTFKDIIQVMVLDHKTFLLIETNMPHVYHKLVDEQNLISSTTRKSFREEEFVNWDDVKDKLG